MPTPIVIDLSHHNEIFSDLKAAAAAGVIGVIHKATEGTGFVDDKVDGREFLARDAGLMFGLYHFLRAGASIDAQVGNFMSVYNRYGRDDILIALDYEKGPDGKTPTLNEVGAWLSKIEMITGNKPVIYSGNALKEAVPSGGHPTINQTHYPLWLAQFTSGTPKLPPGWDSYWLWQYTENGAMAGLKSPVDLNAGDKEKVRQFWIGVAPAPPVTSLDFSDAMRRVLDNEKMRRKGWNGKGMWIAYHHPVGDITLPFIVMSTVQGDRVPWLASQTDMCANDWEEAS